MSKTVSLLPPWSSHELVWSSGKQNMSKEMKSFPRLIAMKEIRHTIGWYLLGQKVLFYMERLAGSCGS